MRHINFRNTAPILCCLILTLLSISVLQGQPSDPAPPTSTIPIDGGVGMLMALGATYGIKKMRDMSNK